LCYDAFYCKVLEIGFYDDRDKDYRQEGFDPETARLQGCPLVSVPAHGDLIDRDAYAYPGDLIDEPVIIPAEEASECLNASTV
jgi:hypothetical protein